MLNSTNKYVSINIGGYNKISKHGLSEFTKFMKLKNMVKYLHMGIYPLQNTGQLGNNLGSEGLKILSEGLKNLCVLSISNCGLCVEGAKLFAQVLKDNKLIQFLDIGYNKMLSEGCIEICKSLIEVDSIISIKLSIFRNFHNFHKVVIKLVRTVENL